MGQHNVVFLLCRSSGNPTESIPRELGPMSGTHLARHMAIPSGHVALLRAVHPPRLQLQSEWHSWNEWCRNVQQHEMWSPGNDCAGGRTDELRIQLPCHRCRLLFRLHICRRCQGLRSPPCDLRSHQLRFRLRGHATQKHGCYKQAEFRAEIASFILIFLKKILSVLLHATKLDTRFFLLVQLV